MSDLATCVDLYIIACREEATLREAEAETPSQLMGELRQRRLKPHVDAFITAYQQAVRVAKANFGDYFASMEEEANALKGPLTADEARETLRALRVWLETRDV